ncbi:MAG: hypothetical protein Q4G08_07685 [Capnocytophaga sp.]|nr:hypothetical protein [Capnocytophaga sp.]
MSLFTLLIVCYAKVFAIVEVRDSLNAVVFNPQKYYYFNDKAAITFSVEGYEKLQRFTEYVVSIESNNDQERSFIFSWEQEEKEQIEVFYLYDKNVLTHIFPLDSELQSIDCQLYLDVINHHLTLRIANHEWQIPEPNLIPHNGYKIVCNLSKNPHSKTIYMADMVLMTSENTDKKSRLWWWIFGIIMVDVIVFVLYLLLRKKKKEAKPNSETIIHGISKRSDKNKLPEEKAVYLLGDFKVYDQKGANIASLFSPILKEIFVVLIVKSAENGISTDKIIDLIWGGTQDKKAKNSRAVYFSRLRNLLEKIGNAQLTNENGKWMLSMDDVFVDYWQFRKAVSNDLKNEEWELFLQLISKGTLLKSADYQWISNYQASVSDISLHILSSYIEASKPTIDPQFSIDLANIINQFDTLNEDALIIKCKSYITLGQHSKAKEVYDKFANDYQQIYGESFSKSFNEIKEFT